MQILSSSPQKGQNNHFESRTKSYSQIGSNTNNQLSNQNNNLLQTGDEAKARYKEVDARFDTAYPGVSMGANLTGAIGSGVALGTTKPAQKLYCAARWFRSMGEYRQWCGAY